jgi:hypothetical protein
VLVGTPQQKLLLCCPPILHCVISEISLCSFCGFQLIAQADTFSLEYAGRNGAASSEYNQGR